MTGSRAKSDRFARGKRPLKRRASRPAADYLELVGWFPLKPIAGEAHLREAHAVIESLAVIEEHRLTPGQADYLYALSELVWVYEQAHHAIADAGTDAIETLQYLMDESGMNASDLGRLLDNRQLGSAILRRERDLSKSHVIKLCEHFKVSADLFLKTKARTQPKVVGLRRN